MQCKLSHGMNAASTRLDASLKPMLYVYLLAREFTCMHNYVLHWYCMQGEVDARNTQIQQQTAEIQGKEAEINRLQRQLRVRIKKTLRNCFDLENDLCVQDQTASREPRVAALQHRPQQVS